MMRWLALVLVMACGSSNSTLPAPAEFAREVQGSGPPMILIPGLGGSAELWREAVEQYRDRYQVHALTLAGFGGQPPLPGMAEGGSYLPRMRDAIAAYAGRLDRPVIIGHSLGAHLALAVAAAAPDRAGPVIAIDGAPFGAALADDNATPDSMRPRAEANRKRVQAIPPAELEANARLMFSSMVGPENLDRVLAPAGKSDPQTVGQAMYELMTTDLRPQMSAIRAPVLLIVSGDNAPEPGDLAYYQAQLEPIPDHRVMVIPGTRHFVMLDDPAATYGAIDEFLASRQATK